MDAQNQAVPSSGRELSLVAACQEEPLALHGRVEQQSGPAAGGGRPHHVRSLSANQGLPRYICPCATAATSCPSTYRWNPLPPSGCVPRPSRCHDPAGENCGARQGGPTGSGLSHYAPAPPQALHILSASKLSSTRLHSPGPTCPFRAGAGLPPHAHQAAVGGRSAQRVGDASVGVQVPGD